MTITSKILILVFVFSSIINSVSAQDNAKVYFIRSTGYQGSAAAFRSFIDGKLVCRLNNKKYSIHEVSVGEHTFATQFSGNKLGKKTEILKINIEAGKTYYFQMNF